MLLPRIIPCILVKDRGLVKTVKFNNYKYVGDPINAVKIYNEKCVDELVVLDIDSFAKKNDPNYKMISHLAMESRMPLCYGGGIKTLDEATKILSMGVEKIALSSSIINNHNLIKDIAEVSGRQSVVVVLNVKKKRFGNKYDLFIKNGKIKTGLNPIQFAKKVQRLGCGEIIINSIDNDGVMKGYDFKLIEQIRNSVSIPITALGGAGTLDDIGLVIQKFGVIGVAAGSIFVFKGKYKAVLINYPNAVEKDNLLKKYFQSYVSDNTKS